MINNELEQRKLGLAYADKLSMIAADAPDVYTEHAVHELAKVIRKRFSYSRELRKKEILTHLKRHSEQGGMSVAELVEATGYNKNRVYESMDELVDEGKAEVRWFPPPGDRGGRPSARYFAKAAGVGPAAVGFSQEKT